MTSDDNGNMHDMITDVLPQELDDAHAEAARVLIKCLNAHIEFSQKLGKDLMTLADETVSQFQTITTVTPPLPEPESARSCLNKRAKVEECEMNYIVPNTGYFAVNIRDQLGGKRIVTIEIGPEDTVNDLRTILLWWYNDRLRGGNVRYLLFNEKNLMFNNEYLQNPNEKILEIPSIKNGSDIFIATFR